MKRLLFLSSFNMNTLVRNNEYTDEIVNTLFYKMVSNINERITRTQSEKIFKTARFIDDMNEQYKLRALKDTIERILKNSKLNYCKNVSVDLKTGFFIKTAHSVNIDFVICPDNQQSVSNSSIQKCVVINCKYIGDNRMKDDIIVIKQKPLKYYIATVSKEYPARFVDMENVSVITDYINNDDINCLPIDNFVNDIFKVFQSSKPECKQFKYIELCDNLGSFHYSMNKKWNHSKCVLSYVDSKVARKIYEDNFKITPFNDFNNIDFKTYNADAVFIHEFQACRHDVLTKIISLEKYNILVLENDDNLLFSNTECFIMKHLKLHNYKVITKILTCSDYGIPQNRRHAFMVCLHSSKFEKDISFYENIFDYILKTRKDTTQTLTDYLHNGINFEMTTSPRIRYNENQMNTRKWKRDEYKAVNKQGKQFMCTLSINDIKRLQGFDNNYKLTGTKKDKKMLLNNSIPTNLTNIVVSFIESIY